MMSDSNFSMQQKLPFAQLQQVAVVHGDRAREELVGNGEAMARELAERKGQKLRPIATSTAERGQHRGRFAAKHADRAAAHACSRANATRTEDIDAAGDHVEAGTIARRSADDEHAAAHAVTDLVADVAANENRAAGHAAAA